MPLRAPAHDKAAVRSWWETNHRPSVTTTLALPPVSVFTDDQNVRVERAKAWGVDPAVKAMQVAIWAKIPFWVLCAYLMQETAGGYNRWGSDSTWMRGVELRTVGISLVSEELFLAYRVQRDDFGMQGVGPLQLTHYTIQNRADQLGGCHLVVPNMATGAEWISVLKADGLSWHDIAKRYNGSEAYADHNDELRAEAYGIIIEGKPA